MRAIHWPKSRIQICDGNTLKYRLALGLEWIKDLGDQEKGIGSDADLLSPFGGIALVLQNGTMLIPLVQQFWNYSGQDVNTTAFRLIAMQPLPRQMWLKLDAKVSVDWENDLATPADPEIFISPRSHTGLCLRKDPPLPCTAHHGAMIPMCLLFFPVQG